MLPFVQELALAAKDVELRAKEEEHIAALKSKDEIFTQKEEELASTKQAAKEHIASNDRAALAVQEQHVMERERQEAEFQGRMAQKMGEFDLLEEEYNIDLAHKDDELERLRTELQDTLKQSRFRTPLFPGPDNKYRTFMFAYSGRGIDVRVFESDAASRVTRVETGVLVNGQQLNYCVMTLGRNFGRRYINLMNVIDEYNGMAIDGWKVRVELVSPGDNENSHPQLYVLRMHPVNEIQRRVVRDRVDFVAGRLTAYQVWSKGGMQV
jgi:hypothetical protein